MSDFHLKVVTPEKVIFDDQVNQVNIDTELGKIGILPHHANLMSKIIPGELLILQDNQETVLATGEGLLNMVNGQLSIVTDLAKSPEEIDEAIVTQAHQRALLALEQKLSDEEYAKTLAIIEKSLAQLRIKRRHPRN